MRRHPASFLSSILLAGAACAFHAAHGAELGDARVASHIGQQLVADIELTMVDDATQPVGVRLADPEVYRGAGIALPPVLGSLHLAVMRRDGRQFLHVTSLRPVDADHLHLYLELVDRNQRVVRLATLWLTPDPNPAPAPVPPQIPVSMPVPDAVPTRLAAQLPARLPTTAPASAPTSVARTRAAPPAREARHAAHASPVLAARHGAEPAACLRQAEAAQACAALGEKNAALRAQLGSLEDKVKGLQASLGSAPAPAPAPAPARPKPIQSIKPLVPRKPAAPPPDDGLPWGAIAAGAGVLAAAGAGVGALRRRNRVRLDALPEATDAAVADAADAADAAPERPATGLRARLARLRARFGARKNGEAPVEPVLE